MDFVAMYMVKKLAGTVEKTFNMIDVNKNGMLDTWEVKRVLKKLGVRPECLETDVKILMDALDENGDGMISLVEFTNWYINQKIRATSSIEKLFNVYDQDRDGFLNRSEFQALITAVNGTEPPQEMIELILKNIGPSDLITLNNTITWFESQNPINRGSIFKQRHSSIARGSIMPRQSNEKRSIIKSEQNSREGGVLLKDKERISINSISNEKNLSKTFTISDDILSVGLELDDTISISFPSGKG